MFSLMSFYVHPITIHFHVNGFAPDLTLSRCNLQMVVIALDNEAKFHLCPSLKKFNFISHNNHMLSFEVKKKKQSVELIDTINK